MTKPLTFSITAIRPRHGGAVLRDGDFVIVPPEDAHRPNCQANGPCVVRKIVVKVKV